MKLIFKVGEILDHFEGPELFTAKDQFGAQFLFYFAAAHPEAETFLGTPITESQLRLVRSGSIPVRSVFENPEIPYFCLAHLEKNGGPIEVEIETDPIRKAPEDLLPPESYRLEADVKTAEQSWNVVDYLRSLEVGCATISVSQSFASVKLNKHRQSFIDAFFAPDSSPAMIIPARTEQQSIGLPWFNDGRNQRAGVTLPDFQESQPCDVAASEPILAIAA